MKRGNKKAISPVIATVLLITLVVVLGLIVFMWFRGTISESNTKFGKNIELGCQEVMFEADYNGETLTVSNLGQYGLYRVNIKVESESGHETLDIIDISNWPENGLGSGGVFSENIGSLINGDKITIIPVLLGTTEGGQQSYTCDENYGIEISI